MLALGLFACLDALFSASIVQSVFYFSCKTGGLFEIAGRLSSILTPRRLLGGLIVIVISVLLGLHGDEGPFFDSWWQALALIIIYPFVETLRSSCAALLNAAQDRVAYGFQIVSDSILMLSATTTALVYQADLLSLASGILVARAASLVLAMHLVKSRLLQPHSKYPSTCETSRDGFGTREILMHARPFVAMGAIGWAVSYADRYIVAWSAGLAAAGVYAVAAGLVGRPYNVIGSALAAHFRPELYATAAAKEGDGAARRCQTKWSLLALGFGGIGMIMAWLFADQIAYLLLAAEHRHEAARLIPILSLASTATLVTHVFDNKILARGEGSRLLFLQIACVPLGVLSLFAGSEIGGAIGAAWGRVVSESLRLAAVALFATPSRKKQSRR